MKILYAASNNQNAKIQLSRFMKAIQGKPYNVKVAAYKSSSPNINIDWTLDCLLNIYKPEHISLDNDNFQTYYEQVKYFNPDLIISDLEYFTSHIANVLNITLFQCSSSIINFGLNPTYKYNLGVFKKYAYTFNKNPIQTQRFINILENSNCNFVYSHFGDMDSPPLLKENFEWIRPYHSIGNNYVPCQHNIVAASLDNNKKIVALLKEHQDSVYFSEFCDELYNEISLKDIRNQDEFYCNLRNSNLFVCEGQTSFLADAFYNSKYSIVLPDLEDPECVLNSTISERLNLSTSIYDKNVDLYSYMSAQIPIHLNDKVKFLHERIEEL